MSRRLKERVPALMESRLSGHCHNDLGLAVATVCLPSERRNQVECTITVWRKGRECSWKEIVMALRSGQPLIRCETGIYPPRFFVPAACKPAHEHPCNQ